MLFAIRGAGIRAGRVAPLRAFANELPLVLWLASNTPSVAQSTVQPVTALVVTAAGPWILLARGAELVRALAQLRGAYG